MPNKETEKNKDSGRTFIEEFAFNKGHMIFIGKKSIWVMYDSDEKDQHFRMNWNLDFLDFCDLLES